MPPDSTHTAPELRALIEAGVTLTSELSLDAVLKRVVDISRDLVKARYGAMSVLDDSGNLEKFITSGLSPEDQRRIGDPPQRTGLLGVIINEGTTLRLEDLTADDRSRGFPPHHPEMHSLLGVPIGWAGRVIGNLYLTEKVGGSFTESDEEIVKLLATQAAVAVRNAELYSAEKQYTEEWQELFEIGRDVTAASTSLRSLIDSVVRKARRLLDTDSAFIMLIEGDDSSIRMAAHDGLTTEAMKTLRLVRDNGLQGLALRSSRPIVVDDYAGDERLKGRRVRLIQEEGLVSQICAPLRGKSGPIGTLTVGSRSTRKFGDRAVDLVEALANWVAVAIESNRMRTQLESLARLEERERIAMDLHDGVIQSIYAVGLQLEDVAERVEEEPKSSRAQIEATINSLNGVIKDIRSYIFDLRPSESKIEDLPAAIGELADDLRVNTLIEADVTLDGTLNGSLSDAQALGLYHIAQEALNNIGKHSKASTARVALSSDGRSVRLEIHDNGIGLPVEGAQHRGQGIRNMQDRANALGATIAFESEQQKGTTIRVVMPLDSQTEAGDGR
jgi:two-component system sensor histidine kinase DevS